MSKTETSRLCVGVDLHKTQFTVCALSDDGEYLLEKKYPTKEEGYNEFSSEMHNREEQGVIIQLQYQTVLQKTLPSPAEAVTMRVDL